MTLNTPVVSCDSGVMNSSSVGSHYESHSKSFVNTECLDKFSEMVQNASMIANRLSSNELLTAFQISFNLIEKISDVMLNTCSSTRTEHSDCITLQERWKCYPCCQSSLERASPSVGINDCESQSNTVNDEDFELEQLNSNNNNNNNRNTNDNNNNNDNSHNNDQLKLIVNETVDETTHDIDSNTNLNLSNIKSDHTISPKIENHSSPTNLSIHTFSSSLTNESSINDPDENYSINHKFDLNNEHMSSELIMDEDDSKLIIDDKVNSSKNSQKNSYNLSQTDNENNNNHLDGNQEMIDKSLISTSELCEKLTSETTNNMRNGSKFSNDNKRWRLSSSDKLNALIDECERQLNGRKLYVCKFCGKIYEIKSSMRYHMKIIHLQMHLRTTEMQCRICGKQFTCVSAVNRHQSKCILSTLAESRLQKNNSSNSFINTNSDDLTNVDRHSHSHLHNHFLTNGASTDPDKNSPEFNLNTTNFQDSVNNLNITDNSSLYSPNLSRLNLPSAFRIPENSCFLNRPGSNFYGLQTTSSEMGKFMNSVQFTNCTVKTDEHISQPYCIPSSCEIQTSAQTQSQLQQPAQQVDCLDPRWSTTNWPTLPVLGCNFSDLTPAQLDVCMKAVMNGIRSSVEKSSQSLDSITNSYPSLLIPDSADSNELKHSQWSSDDTANTNTTITTTVNTTNSNTNIASETLCDLNSNTVGQTNEMAMDLSARPRSSSNLMIESF